LKLIKRFLKKEFDAVLSEKALYIFGVTGGLIACANVISEIHGEDYDRGVFLQVLVWICMPAGFYFGFIFIGALTYFILAFILFLVRVTFKSPFFIFNLLSEARRKQLYMRSIKEDIKEKISQEMKTEQNKVGINTTFRVVTQELELLKQNRGWTQEIEDEVNAWAKKEMENMSQQNS
jgi:hypothetical protein